MAVATIAAVSALRFLGPRLAFWSTNPISRSLHPPSGPTSKVMGPSPDKSLSATPAPRTSITRFAAPATTSASVDGPSTLGTRSRPASIAASRTIAPHLSTRAPRATLRSASTMTKPAAPT